MSIALAKRTPDHEILPLFLQRWSPRAMSSERISEEELMQLFEAARWAPSSYNEQEWRYVYAARETDHWDTLFSLLVEANQAWCKNASHLVLVASRNSFARNGNPNRVHSFDTGASFQNFALQGASMNLVVHGMAGFNYEEARTALAIPETYSVEAMIAIGRPGTIEDLPESFRDSEVPSLRNPLSAFIAEGHFPFS